MRDEGISWLRDDECAYELAKKVSCCKDFSSGETLHKSHAATWSQHVHSARRAHDNSHTWILLAPPPPRSLLNHLASLRQRRRP